MCENKVVGKVVLGVYLIASLGYIAFDQWGDYKMEMKIQQAKVQEAEIQQVYNKGAEDTVYKLIEEAVKCQPVEVFAGENKVTLKAMECEAAEATATTESE